MAEDFSWDADPETVVETVKSDLIPCMAAWVVFRWVGPDETGAWQPTVVDVTTIDRDDWFGWSQGIRDAGGWLAPVCLDASDAHDQSRALFVAHSFRPGYADRRAALTEFARLTEADWARDLLAKETH